MNRNCSLLLMKVILIPLCLLISGRLLAGPVLQTVTGGPAQFNPRYYGYADGPTASMAQFDFPCGLALDPSGTLLLRGRFHQQRPPGHIQSRR